LLVSMVLVGMGVGLFEQSNKCSQFEFNIGKFPPLA
jgi:hypothetical protein